jgi:hypothetical protein
VVDFATRCTAAAVRWSKDAEDNVPLLSGGVEAGDVTYTAALEATVYQDDLTEGGLVDYTWANKGAVVPFTYTPFSGSRAISGEVTIDPLDVGGDVGKKNTSDIAWACLGEPVLVDDLG